MEHTIGQPAHTSIDEILQNHVSTSRTGQYYKNGDSTVYHHGITKYHSIIKYHDIVIIVSCSYNRLRLM